MFNTRTEASRIRLLTAWHQSAIMERELDDQDPYQECLPACQTRDPFVCTCDDFEPTETPLESIPVYGDGIVSFSVCAACGELAHLIGMRCFECLDVTDPHVGHEVIDVQLPSGDTHPHCATCGMFV